jgi:hypothetical protein
VSAGQSYAADHAEKMKRCDESVPQSRVWSFAGCEVHEFPDRGDNGYLETRWPDGAMCPATRDHTMENATYAAHLGYTNVRDALREHEMAHTFVAEKLGFPWSPTLRAVADGFPPGSARGRLSSGSASARWR